MNSLVKLTTTTTITSCRNILKSPIGAITTLFNNYNNNNLFEQNRTAYTFTLSQKVVRYRRATRPKKTNDNSLNLDYEQSQFAEKIGVTKSWNTWNTCKLKRKSFKKKN
jgi:hypothetical protein